MARSMFPLGRACALIAVVVVFGGAASACAGPGGAAAEPTTSATQPATTATQPATGATQPAIGADAPASEAEARFLAECVPACERRSAMKAVGWQVIQAECARTCAAEWADR